MKIRNYQPADYETIARNLQKAGMYDETWDAKSNFESLTKEQPSNILVSEIEGKVVGSVLIDQFGKDVAFIYRLVVDENYRKRGIAGEILEAVYDVLRARGTREVALFVDVDKTELIEYYRSKGFTEGRHKYKAMWRAIS